MHQFYRKESVSIAFVYSQEIVYPSYQKTKSNYINLNRESSIPLPKSTPTDRLKGLAGNHCYLLSSWFPFQLRGVSSEPHIWIWGSGDINIQSTTGANRNREDFTQIWGFREESLKGVTSKTMFEPWGWASYVNKGDGAGIVISGSAVSIVNQA